MFALNPRQFQCSKVDLPMIYLGGDMCNSTFLFLDRLSKLGSRSTSMMFKESNLLWSFIGSVDPFGNLFTFVCFIIIFGGRNVSLHGCYRVWFCFSFRLCWLCSSVFMRWGSFWAGSKTCVWNLRSCYNLHAIMWMTGESRLRFNGACCNFEFACICLCWFWGILERNDQFSGLSIRDNSCWFDFVHLFFWDPLWKVYSVCRVITLAVSTMFPLGPWFILMALLAKTCPYDLVLTFSFMTFTLLTLKTPQRVGKIRLNRNAEESCLYQGRDLRGNQI